MAACQAVFNNYELIESILAELPPLELGAALAICSSWRQIMQGSSRIAPVQVQLPEYLPDPIKPSPSARPTYLMFVKLIASR